MAHLRATVKLTIHSDCPYCAFTMLIETQYGYYLHSWNKGEGAFSVQCVSCGRRYAITAADVNDLQHTALVMLGETGPDPEERDEPAAPAPTRSGALAILYGADLQTLREVLAHLLMVEKERADDHGETTSDDLRVLIAWRDRVQAAAIPAAITLTDGEASDLAGWVSAYLTDHVNFWIGDYPQDPNYRAMAAAGQVLLDTLKGGR